SLLAHSVVQGGFPAGSNILDADPDFADAASGDYALASGSPAIDAGDHDHVLWDHFDVDEDGDLLEDAPDLAGNVRRVDDTALADTGNGVAPLVDMGAFERQGPSAAAGVIVNPIDGLVTTEAGGSASFTVALETQPLADVSIALSSSDTTE